MSGVQYSEPIDAVIYGRCATWDGDDFLELAIAALDQWGKLCDREATATIVCQLRKMNVSQTI